jgi:MFS transporter, FHS family, glucose/mannose:H+ symporter
MKIFYPLLAISGLIMFIQGPTMKPIMETFSVTETIAGLLPFAYFVGNLLGVASFPRLATTLGSRNSFFYSALFVIVGLVMAASAPSIYVLLVGFLIFGTAVGIFVSLPSALLAQEYGAGSARLINHYYAVFAVGILIGPPVAGYLYDAGYGWRPIYWMTAAIMAAFLLPIWRSKLPDLERAEQRGLQNLTAAIKASPPILFGTMMLLFLYLGIEASINYWSVKYVQDTFPGTSALYASMSISGFWILIMVGRFGSSFLLKHISRSTLLYLLFGGSTVTVFFAAQAPSALIAILAITLSGLFLSGAWPTLVGFSERFPRHLTGVAMSVILIGGGLGGAIVPYLFGILAAATDYRRAFMVSLIMPLLAILLLATIKPETRKFRSPVN